MRRSKTRTLGCNEMWTVRLRVRFATEEDARREFHAFPAHELDYLKRIERKRDGASWVLVAELMEHRDLNTLLALLRAHRFVTEVKEISEYEWTQAPSHS